MAVAQQQDGERSEAARNKQLWTEGAEYQEVLEHPAMPWILLEHPADPWHTQVSISTQLTGWEILGTVKRGC